MPVDRNSSPDFQTAVRQEVERQRRIDQQKRAREALDEQVNRIEDAQMRSVVLGLLGSFDSVIEENRELRSEVDRLTTELSVVATAYQDVAGAQKDLEEGQLNPSARAKVRNAGVLYGSATSGSVFGFIELLRYIIGG